MDVNQRTAVVTAAVAAVGPVAENWEAAVTSKAVEIAVMLGENSDVSKAINSIENCKIFTGTVTAVTKEQSSTRGIITLFTGTEQTRDGIPAGHEQVRTERTDNPVGRALAIKARELIGHKVTVWVEVEAYNNGAGKVRVLRHIADRGVDPTYAPSA